MITFALLNFWWLAANEVKVVALLNCATHFSIDVLSTWWGTTIQFRWVYFSAKLANKIWSFSQVLPAIIILPLFNFCNQSKWVLDLEVRNTRSNRVSPVMLIFCSGKKGEINFLEFSSCTKMA